MGIRHEITCDAFEASKSQRALSKEILSLLLYAAGLSSYTKDFHSSNQWSKLINQEFQAELLEERRRGLEITKHYKILCDETLFNANEANIMSLVVLPVYKRVYKLEKHFCKETTRVRRETKYLVCTSDEGALTRGRRGGACASGHGRGLDDAGEHRRELRRERAQEKEAQALPENAAAEKDGPEQELPGLGQGKEEEARSDRGEPPKPEQLHHEDDRRGAAEAEADGHLPGRGAAELPGGDSE